jgi:hypothetical protein
VRTVLAVLGMLLLLSCAVPILAGWRNPSSTFLVGLLQTRDARSKDPARTAAAACWLILGFAAGSVALVASLPYVGAMLAAAGCAVAAWVRFGDAPQSLRPVALRGHPGSISS